MKILLITTYYPPMSSIASVRPWALSHYLVKNGNEVTVLCAGRLGKTKVGEMYSDSKDVQVVRCYPLPNDYTQDALGISPGRNILSRLRKIYHDCDRFLQSHGNYWLYFVTRWISAYQYLKKEKKEIDKIKKNGKSFDVIISTFGGVENFFAGKYASDIFQCPLIQDFRDTISSGYCDSGWIRGYINKKAEKWAIKNADAITGVSDDMLKHMMQILHLRKTYNVIYNGYVPIETQYGNSTASADKLVFCYTGTIYEKDDFSALLRVISNLIKTGKIKKDKIVINYAGRSWDYLSSKVEKYDLKSVVINHGYLTFEDAFALQNNSDIFLVASWNDEEDTGVICGKFSEGIRLKKPIVCLVSGSKPNSELYRLNEKYHYGFCFEEASRITHESKLEEYVYRQYKRKIKDEQLYYDPISDLFTDFRYDFLANIMEKVCIETVRKWKKGISEHNF